MGAIQVAHVLCYVFLVQAAERELQLIFDGKAGPTATLTNCLCVIIKPHAIREKGAGKIIRDIQKAGCKVTAMEQRHLSLDLIHQIFATSPICEEDVKGMLEGPIIAMELSDPGATLHLSDIFGAEEPEEARTGTPTSIR